MATITPKELAEELGTDPKTVRKFLRNLVPDRASKGGRWAIDTNDLDTLRTLFASWKKGRTTTLNLDQLED